jgi:hypothetical protein
MNCYASIWVKISHLTIHQPAIWAVQANLVLSYQSSPVKPEVRVWDNVSKVNSPLEKLNTGAVVEFGWSGTVWFVKGLASSLCRPC